MAGRVIQLCKRLAVVPLATNDAAACGFAAQFVKRSRPPAILLPHIGCDDPLWGTAAGAAGGEPSFTSNVIKRSKNQAQGGLYSVCSPSPNTLADIVCSEGNLNRLLRGPAFQVKERLTARRKQDSMVAITYSADLGQETIKVLDAPLTAVYHAERANRSLRVLAGGLPYWALGGYLVRTRSEAQLRELVAEAVHQNRGVSNTIRDTLLELAPDAHWASLLYTAAVMGQAQQAAVQWGQEHGTASPRRPPRRQRQSRAVEQAAAAPDVSPTVVVPVPVEHCQLLLDAWAVLEALQATEGSSAPQHCWLDWDTLQSAAGIPTGQGVLLTAAVTAETTGSGGGSPQDGVISRLDDDALTTGAALLRLHSRDAPMVPEAAASTPVQAAAATAAAHTQAGGDPQHAADAAPADWAGDTQPEFDAATLEQRHSLRTVISGLGLEHGGPAQDPPKTPSDGNAHPQSVSWGAYHDRHAASQAQSNEEELWFMPEHVQSPTGTHLRALYSAQLTAHTPKDYVQVQRTAERRAQQLLRRMRFMLSQQRRAEAEGMQLAFDAAAMVALPGLAPAHEVRQQFVRSRALQQEAFSSTSDSSDGGEGVPPSLVLSASQLGTYVPPPMTPHYAASFGLNDITPDFAQKWNARREQQIRALQAASDRVAGGDESDGLEAVPLCASQVPGDAQEQHRAHAAARATQPAATGAPSVDSHSAVVRDGSRRALPLLPSPHHTDLGSLLQQLCLFTSTAPGSPATEALNRPSIALGPVPVPGLHDARLVAVPFAPPASLLASDALDATDRQRKLGVLNALFDSPPERSTHAYAPIAAADLWGWWMRDHNTWPGYWPDLPQVPYSPAAADAYMQGLTSQRNALAFDAGRGGAGAGFDARTQEQREEDTAARRFDVTQYDWDI